jgi:hypothetical protein
MVLVAKQKLVATEMTLPDFTSLPLQLASSARSDLFFDLT